MKGLKGFQKGNSFGKNEWNLNRQNHPSYLLWRERKICFAKQFLSDKFKGKNNPFYGKTHSEETKRKISLIHKNKTRSLESRRKQSISCKGKPKSEEHKRKIGIGNKNKIRSKEMKERISKTKRESEGTPRKEKNPNWQGGKSFEPYGIKFNNKLKEEIRKRDKYECQQCGINQNKLNYSLCVHHINFNKQNNNPLNLISLCKICHLQTNFNRQDWTNYFQNKIIERRL